VTQLTPGIAEFLLARYDEHIARCWERGAAPGSAFVRDEYGALRKVVELHRERTSSLVGIIDPAFGSVRSPDDFEQIVYSRPGRCFTCRLDHPEGPCPTLLALVQPYADHPDFDPVWAV
jgi:hypothetical protein